MSKKETKKEEVVEDTSKKVTKNNKSNGELKTLIELVDNSKVGKFIIGVKLSKSGYLKQYHEEEKLRKGGFPIEPSMTEEEFNKIIGE